MPGPPAQREKRDEEQNRIELRRDAESQPDAGPHRLSARPGVQREADERRRGKVPVGERVQREGRGQCDHRRVPPSSRTGRPARRDDEQHRGAGEHQRGHVEEAIGVLTVREEVGAPRAELHQPADDHWVLDVVVEVRVLAVDEALGKIERGDVGVAHPCVLVLVLPPSRVTAR